MRTAKPVRDTPWTKAYPTNREGYDDIRKAISREKQVKKWARECKNRLRSLIPGEKICILR